MLRFTFGLIASLFTLASAAAQEAEPLMTVERLSEIIYGLDQSTRSNGVHFQMTIHDIPVLILTDAHADRMRTLIPIRSLDEIKPEDLLRVLQANFDTALDARYAVAKGKLWATFIHPLSPLKKDEFISGLGQTINLVETYGTLYSGGALSFNGGDSAPLQRQLIDELLKKGNEI